MDFLIADDHGPFRLIEAKGTETRPSLPLKKFQNALRVPAVQLIAEGDGYRLLDNNGLPFSLPRPGSGFPCWLDPGSLARIIPAKGFIGSSLTPKFRQFAEKTFAAMLLLTHIFDFENHKSVRASPMCDGHARYMP